MATDTHPPLQHLTLAQIAREQRLQVILRKGLPPFRQTALELGKVLGGASPDLKKAGKLISTDPTFSSQVLRMCNSPLLGLHSRVISIDHAAVLLGPERLRSLALTGSVADFAGQALPEAQMSAFWEHSFLTAMLSQFLAERWKYFEKYQAYIAGLLHDIGQVPEWMLLGEGAQPDAPPSDWLDNPIVEQEYFATDHCKLGGAMAGSWGLMPSFLDVLENHHTPELAQRDSVLVRIVATADNFLTTKTQSSVDSEGAGAEAARQRFEELGVGLFNESGWPHVRESLEREYTRVLPLAQAGLNGLLGADVTAPARGNQSQPQRVTESKADIQDPQLGRPLSTPLAAANSPKPAPRVRNAKPSPARTTFFARCKAFFGRIF